MTKKGHSEIFAWKKSTFLSICLEKSIFYHGKIEICLPGKIDFLTRIHDQIRSTPLAFLWFGNLTQSLN